MFYSTDLRSRVLELIDKGKSPKESALLFKISRVTFFGRNSLWRMSMASLAPKAARCIERKKLSDLVQAQSDLMLKKLAQKLDSCRSTVHANLQVLRLGCKKTLQYSQAFSVKNLQVCKMFLKRRCLKENRASSLTYLDETGFASSSYRTHGRATKGKKVHGKCSALQRPRTSLIRYLFTKKLIAPVLFDGICNTEIFNVWLAQQLLHLLVTGSIIVMDNATFQKSSLSRQLIEQVGCELLYLPAYSPCLNPIKKCGGT